MQAAVPKQQIAASSLCALYFFGCASISNLNARMPSYCCNRQEPDPQRSCSVSSALEIGGHLVADRATPKLSAQWHPIARTVGRTLMVDRSPRADLAVLVFWH